MKVKFVLFLSLVFFWACSQMTPEQQPLQAPALRLVTGGSLSLATADEYNPYLFLNNNDNKLYLIFASNRSCSGCTGHNLFIARTTQTYSTKGQIPAFETPQLITFDNIPINSPTPLQFTVIHIESPGVALEFFIKNPSTEQIEKATLSYTSTNDANNFTVINNTGHRNLRVIGSAYSWLYGADNNGQVYNFDPEQNQTELTPAIPHLRNAQSIAPATSIMGYSNPNFLLRNGKVSIAGLLYDYHQQVPPQLIERELRDFNLSTARSALDVQAISVMNLDPYGNDLNLELFLFSAHDGRSSDLYAVTSHSPRELWGLVAPLRESY